MTESRTSAGPNQPSPDESVTPAPFAAAVYVPRQPRGNALARFIAGVKADGVRVGGMVQDVVLRDDGSRERIDTIDIATGKRIVINQSTNESLRNHECSLDVAALTETTSVLRRAVDDGAELIVVEKFGAKEAEGGGLSGDILDVIAAGVPMLVAVPETSLDAWIERTGGLGAQIEFSEQAFRDWWAGTQQR
ncbi:MAG: DUF2478 domain-containing protein [Rhodospirillaceae bacterium]|jgi:uncharacterized protein|nr:DUF2478 domain-containing protein [Rhodospirillaceae bacterium]